MGRSRSLGKRIDVAVCVPTSGLWQADFGRSLAMMFVQANSWRPEGVRSFKISLFSKFSSMLVHNRHELVLHALKRECTHVLFLDDDMVFPPDTLQRLLGWDKDFVAANCTTKGNPTEFIAHDLGWKRVDSRGKEGVQRVQHVGLAVALIKTDVFMAMDPPLFMMEWVPDMQAYCGEDVFFCAKAQEKGIEIWVDHGLSREVGHVGKLVYGAGLVGEELREWNVST